MSKDAAISELATPSPAASRIQALQQRQLELQIADLEEAKDLKEQQKRQQDAVRLAGARALADRHAQQLAIQNSCPHMKPNMQPAIGGQKDHKGEYHFICLYCAKEFNSHTIPPHLRPDQSIIGGPM